MPRTEHGSPIGLEIAVKDTKRASEFYSSVFNWSFKNSTLGAPPERLLVFSVAGDKLPGGGVLRKVSDEEFNTAPGTTKVFLYVDDMDAAMEKIVKSGGKQSSPQIPEGDKVVFQYFEDCEGNGQAIYTEKA